jgi:uncharacterized protein YdaU (DUF1376 family)
MSSSRSALPRPGGFVVYPRDFTADAKVELMNTEEVGAYWLLLCKAWHETPAGSLPNDDRALAVWSKLTPERFAACKPNVMAPFELKKDGRWHQPWMKSEFDKCIEIRVKRSDAANKRWKRDDANALQGAMQKQCKSNAFALHEQCMSNANGMQEQCTQTKPNQTKPNQERENARAPERYEIPETLDTPLFRKEWNRWIEHLEGVGKTVSRQMLIAQLASLERLGEKAAIAALQRSIEKGAKNLITDTDKHTRNRDSGGDQGSCIR